MFQDSEVSTVGLTDSNQRCTILTFLAVEPDGQWKIVAVPLGRGPHVNHLGSATPGSSVNSHQSQNKGNGNKFLVSKEEKSGKRNSRKKIKKKGKQNKKLSGETGLSEVECGPGGATSKIGTNDCIHNGVALLPYATKIADITPENICNGIYSEGSSSRGYAYTSCIEEVGVSEALTLSALPSFSCDQHRSDFEDRIQTSEVHDTKCELISYPNVCSATNDRLVLDSLSLGSNFDKSLNCDYEIPQHSKESAGIDISKSPGCAAGEGCSSTGNLLNGIVATDNHGQKTNYNRLACRSEMIEKRVKKIKRVPQNSTGHRVSSVGNLHCHLGRENNHSVWQKVQRNDACERNYDSRNVDSVFSQFGIELKEAHFPKNQRNAYNSSLKFEPQVKKQTNTKVSGKMKRKTSQGSKQESNYYYRKGSQVVRACSNQCTRADMLLNESCTIPVQMNVENRPEAVSRSHSKTSFATNGLQTKRAESIAFKPLQSSQACVYDVDPLESVYATASSLDDQNAENGISLPSKSYSFMDTSEMLEKLSAIQLHTLVEDEVSKIDKNVSHADQKKDTSSGAVWKKWIPIGVRSSDSHDLSLRSGLSTVKLDEGTGGNKTLRTSTEDEYASDSHSTVCAMNSSGTCIGLSLSGIFSSSSNNVAQLNNLGNQTTTIVKEFSNNFGGAQCLISESENQNISTSDIDSRKIFSVVNDSHRAQVASEAIQLATGCPIAEFEKLLHSASPVICPSHNIVSCQTCLCGSVGHASLCRHEMPNISLGELWQWYEKHGSYGLEVRADNYENSNRLGIDRVTFRAYFVPYLSAVQLFTKRKVCQTDNGNVIPTSSAMEARDMVKASKVSNSDHLTIFSILVPQPQAEGSSLCAPDNHVCNSEPSAVSITENQSNSPVKCGWSDDLELLFEYFESEQPQRRRPLYEMIKELVRGDVPPQGRAYGDATILNSVSLHDLHPRSWYSVAWYPVYRIPEGNFRAAFLTYHSLGHLVRRRSAFDSACMDICIVSPVVGLQSYNAQGECWFQPRHTADVLNSNPAEILKDRLRTLEEAASLMARAVVTKGSETSVNMQPDYEFFLSRRRC